MTVVGYLRQHHIGLLALFIALGGTSYALSDPSAGRWYACVTHAYHTLNLTSASATCPRGQHKIWWDRAGSTGRGQRGPQGPPGPRGPRGSRGSPGSGSDTVMTLSANKNLSNTGGVFTSIITVQLPETSNGTQYVLAAQGNLVNFGPSDYTRCQILVNGTQIAAVSTMVGSPRASGNQGPASYLSPFSLTGGTKVAGSGGTATLRCWHDTTNGATPYVDANTSIWVHQTGSLTTGTE